MAIGKPLLVQERKGVAKPVLSPQTQQLSTNVAAQKMEMANYNIGMNNAMASQQVTGELVSMVNAGINAKVYAEQTKQQYNRLNLMEDWNKTDNEFKTRFAKAITPEEQEVVINDFSVSMEKRTADYRKGGGTGLPTGDSIQSQRDLSSLRNRSNNLYSKFTTTMNANINTRTNAMLDTRNKSLVKSAITDPTSDPISIINELKSNYAGQVKVGGLLPDQAIWNLNVATDKIIAGRGGLFAENLARETIDSNTAVPFDSDELKERMEKVMNMPLNERQHKLLDDVYTETYYKELAAFNAEENAEVALGMSRSKELRGTYEANYQTAIADGKLSGEEKKNLIEQAKGIDHFVNGWSIEKIAKLENFRFGQADNVIVEAYTTGDKSEEIRARLDPEMTGIYAQDKLDELAVELRAEGNTEKTITSILSNYSKENVNVEKDLMESAPKFMAAKISKNITDGTPSGTLMYEDHWYDIGKVPVGAVGWLDKMKSGVWGEVVTQTLAELKVMKKQNQGVFSEKNDNLSVKERLAEFKKDVNLLFQQNLDTKAKEIWGGREDTETSKAYGDPITFQKLEKQRTDAQAKAEKVKLKATHTPSPARPISTQKTAQHQLNTEQLKNNLTQAEQSGKYGAFLLEYIPALNKQLHEQTRITDKARTKENREKTDKIYNDLGQAFSDVFFSSYMEREKERELFSQELSNWALGGLANMVAEQIQKGQEPPSATMEDTKEPVTTIDSSAYLPSRPFTDAKGNVRSIEDENRDKIESGMMGVDSGYKPMGEGKYMPTGKGLWSPTELPQYNTFQDFLKDAEGLKDGGVEYTDLGTDQTNTGYGVNVKGKGVEQLIQKMQKEGKSQEEINEATLDLAISNSRDKANRQYSKSLKEGQVAFDDQPIIIQELLTELAYNSKASLSSKQGWPRLMEAAKNRDYDTVIKEMYLNEKKQGATRRNKLRQAYFETKISEELIPAINQQTDEPPSALARLGEFLSPSPAEASAGQMGLIVPDTYTVQSGDTLSQIAKDNDLKMNEIKALNPQIENINLIKVGQEINLGSMASPEPEIEDLGSASGFIDTAPKAYLKAMAGDTGIWREDLYTKPEQELLRKVAVKKIKQGILKDGNLSISYKDWTPEAGSKIGYKMDMPDTSRVDNNLQYTLGKAEIVREGNKVLVVDEWDIQSPEKIHDMPLWDRVGTIYEKMKQGDASLYGLAHLLGEAFGPQAGEGASIRAVVGTSKSLKLSKAQMKKIPTLEQYEAKNAGRINPKNLGKADV